MTVHCFVSVLFCWLNSVGMRCGGTVELARLSPSPEGGAIMARKSHPVKEIKADMIKAVQMSLDGMSSDQIGKILGKDGSTVRRWLRKPEVVEEYRAAIQAEAIPIVAKAIRNLKSDLDSNEANGYLRQNASFFALNRYESGLLGENDGSCTITFVNGAPEIGMPDADDDDE